MSTKPQSDRSSATSAAASGSDRSPLHTPFGVPVVPLVQCIGRARGSPRASGYGRAEPGQDGLVRDDQRGREAGQDPLPLVGREPRVQRDRHDSGGEQADHHVEVVQGRRHEQRDPVTLYHGYSPRSSASCSTSVA